MKHKFPVFVYFVFFYLSGFAQINDSVLISSPETELPDIDVVGYLHPQNRLQTPASVGIIDKADIEEQSIVSMVPVMNTIPGIRMEERSPGSYRLSIRGSLVRSPYGIRNVKIYYNDFALTDAGGNTYLNVLNVNDLSGIEILKGPDGSLFGANSGGVVFLKSNTNQYDALEIKGYGGSNGLSGEAVYLGRNVGNHFLTFRQSYQRSDGYRDNSANYRLFFQLSDRWQYSRSNVFEAYAFYSELDYRTPGGLTKEQYDENPRQSRPPTATMPGSAEQKTRISTRMYFAGIRHEAAILPYLTHVISVWGNHVDFVYPFITNYEIRNEDNLGLRTYFTLSGENTGLMGKDLKPSLNFGFEGTRLVTDAYNYDNHAGVKGGIQAYNDILNKQSFGFLRGKINWREKLVIEAAVSVNFNGYHFRDTTNIKNNFPTVWMPHFAINYRVNDPLALRFTLSKGYSTPTTAEVRPSDNTVHYHLYAEQGWNTEAGIRLNLMNGRMHLDASCFHYLLNDGIISQVAEDGNTYFINSGKIRQLGIEATASYIILPERNNSNFIRKIQWNCNYSYAHYKYVKYINSENNYSGKRVAGIPRNVVINNVQVNLPSGIQFFMQYNYTGRIPLNDANSVYAENYHLLSAQLSIEPEGGKLIPARVFLSADNVLNQKYSLGNDLNAVGGRYYNAAPGFNFQLGASWKW